jgi:hypothetical protein
MGEGPLVGNEKNADGFSERIVCGASGCYEMQVPSGGGETSALGEMRLGWDILRWFMVGWGG